MRRILETMRTAAVLPLLLAVAGCGDDGGAGPDVPTPGLLTVVLETPNPTEGALLVRVTGPSIEEVSAYDPGALLESHTVGTTTTIALFGSLPSGPIARIKVPDTRESYSVQLEQVAAGDNTLHADLQAHAVSIDE